MEPWTGPSLVTFARGWMEPRVLLTGAELDLFTLLSHEPLTAAQVAERLGSDLRALTMVLDALVAMELLAKRDEVYTCAPSVAMWLSSDAPQTVLPMLLHFAHVFHNWANLTDRVGRPAAAVTPEEERLRAFIGAMHVISQASAQEVVSAAPPGDATRLIDVGGGSGSFAIAYLRASPTLRATIFDRAPVVEMAHERLTQAGLLDRADLAAGDFYADELPGGHDLALLSAIIHQNDHAQNVALYGKCFRALVPGGRLVIRDHVLSPDRTRPKAGALFALNMLCATPGGNSYTFAEIRAGLAAAGFEGVELVQADERMNGVVVARRAG